MANLTHNPLTYVKHIRFDLLGNQILHGIKPRDVHEH